MTRNYSGSQSPTDVWERDPIYPLPPDLDVESEGFNLRRLVAYIIEGVHTPRYATPDTMTTTYCGNIVLQESLGFKTLILLTDKVFIGDIDITKAFSKQDILEKIQAHPEYSYFRVYETYHGFRLIYTKECRSIFDDNTARDFLRLQCDSRYIRACVKYGHFAARLSPKNRPDEDVICKLISPGILPRNELIASCIRLHDSYCLSKEWVLYWRSMQCNHVIQ